MLKNELKMLFQGFRIHAGSSYIPLVELPQQEFSALNKNAFPAQQQNLSVTVRSVLTRRNHYEKRMEPLLHVGRKLAASTSAWGLTTQRRIGRRGSSVQVRL